MLISNIFILILILILIFNINTTPININMPPSPPPPGPRRRRPSITTAASTIESAASPLKSAATTTLHLLWGDLPPWRRDNAYIHSGYRPTSNSYLLSLSSILHIHNETVNIWTHLLGAAGFSAGGLILYRAAAARYASATDGDRLVFACFFAGAFLCLGMSATYHALTNHSAAVAKWGNKLDYTGIVLLIVGSYVPAMYYGLFCHGEMMAWGLGMVSLFLSGVVFCECWLTRDRLRCWVWDAWPSRGWSTFARRHGARTGPSCLWGLGCRASCRFCICWPPSLRMLN